MKRFSLICLMRSWLTRNSDDSYVLRYNINDDFDIEEFKQNYYGKIEYELTVIFQKVNIGYYCYEKMLKKIEFAIENQYIYSYKAISSTFNMVNSEASLLGIDD